MRKTIVYLISIGLVLTGTLLIFLGTNRPVYIIIDGNSQIIFTRAITVAQALHDAGVQLGEYDRMQPSINDAIKWKSSIYINRASQVTLIDGSQIHVFTSIEDLPANLLLEMNILLFPGDQILWNGLPIYPDQGLLPIPIYTLQYIQAVPVTIIENDHQRTIYSSKPSVGQALWENGIWLQESDYLSQPISSAPGSQAPVFLQRSVPISIQADNIKFATRSALATVGQVLAESGISLQGLDYSIPGEAQLISQDENIRIVRVKEEIILEQISLPFSNEFVADPNLELDQRSVVEPGQYGLQVTRQRVRYEDEQEVSRHVEAEWIAGEPKTQQLGYGTKIVIRTVDTPDGPREYWRTAVVYATSYSPCRLGVDHCSNITASGMILQKGVIAVACSWYSTLVGQQLYVPGYGIGTIGDCGASIPGKFLVDLGFTDEDFEPWHQDMTVYFLAPVPGNIPWVFP
ncbi:MAG: ubiquitin-like domain-containing protein [Anaerolineaceae bacterium]|nr:ubiquitin-like domain-containing protein [Anaerolineaceae bacterium]